MKYVLIEEKDIGSVPRERFDDEASARLALREAEIREDQRWQTIKQSRPDFPREALSYFRIEKKS